MADGTIDLPEVSGPPGYFDVQSPPARGRRKTSKKWRGRHF
jgi:hypothetical protein